MALTMTDHPNLKAHDFMSLPAEIRNSILDYVFETNQDRVGFKDHGAIGGVTLDVNYTANSRLHPLAVCWQLYDDGNLLAFHRTSFIVTNLFINIPQRVALLQQKQIEAIRHISFVADARHFRNLLSWGNSPFGIANLQLDALHIILHRSSAWHYLFDFTADIVKLLRQLQGVKRLVFVRNRAFVKGSFKTWFNRLVGLIMKVDHQERYGVQPPQIGQSWWTWSFDETAQSFCLTAAPPKPLVDEQSYLEQILPLMEELRISVENEEWNPDPRSWNGT